MPGAWSLGSHTVLPSPPPWAMFLDTCSPAVWCPRTHLASPLPPSLPHAQDSSWVACRGGRRRRGLICAVNVHSQGGLGAGWLSSGAQPWGVSGQAEVVAVLPQGCHCHGMSRQLNRGCILVETSLSFIPNQVPRVPWCTGLKIPEGHPSAVDWGDTPVGSGT